jgi:hypothetical protein
VARRACSSNVRIFDPLNCTRLPNDQLRYEPAVVKLSGILVMDAYYGPPNYGEEPETDPIEQNWTLKLDQPVDVLADPKLSAELGSHLRGAIRSRD